MKLSFYHIKLFAIFYLFLFNINVYAQSDFYENDTERGIRVMFYNVENLFDPHNDSLKLDDEYTPTGIKHWTYSRFNNKLNNIYKVIVAVGEWTPPEIIGLAEIENYNVLYKLITHTPLLKYNYGIIHKDSPDIRGIDVALLYKKDIVVPIASQFFKINFSNSPNKKTRDILYLKANINKTDTIHILINHWSSRLGGQEKSEIYRLNAARILKQITDSILTINPLANILITGDFNDTPINNSIQLFSSLASEFINLSGSNTDSKKGSIKYEGRWYWFDQILVTKIMVSGNCSLCIQADRSILFNPDFLLEEDSKYFGYKPFKTYNGMHYIGGFSDHLPVFTDIRFTKQ